MFFSNVDSLRKVCEAFKVVVDSVKRGDLKGLVRKLKSKRCNIENADIVSEFASKGEARIKNIHFVNDKLSKGLFYFLRSNGESVSGGFIFRFKNYEKTESISLKYKDCSELELARTEAQRLREITKSDKFKKSLLSLKEYDNLHTKKDYVELDYNLYNEWLESIRNKKRQNTGKDIREATIRYYESIYNTFILPHFKGLNLLDLDSNFAREYILKISKNANTLTKTGYGFTKRIFKYLKSKGKIENNIFSDIDFWDNNGISKPTKAHKKHNAKKIKELLLFDTHDKSRFSGLNYKESMQYKLLRFMIYTPLRINNVVMLEWSEVDFEKELLYIKADKIKNKLDFKLPLNAESLKILKELHRVKISDFVFDYRLNYYARQKKIKNAILEYRELKGNSIKTPNRTLANMAKKHNVKPHDISLNKWNLKVTKISLKTQFNTRTALGANFFKKYLGITAHSLRGSFATLISDNLESIKTSKDSIYNLDKDIVGMCLAHEKNDIESVYNVSQMLKSKRIIMDFWNDFLNDLQSGEDSNMQKVSSDSYLFIHRNAGNVETLGGLSKNDLEFSEADSNDNDTLLF